jgi:hypothetical protein
VHPQPPRRNVPVFLAFLVVLAVLAGYGGYAVTRSLIRSNQAAGKPNASAGTSTAALGLGASATAGTGLATGSPTGSTSATVSPTNAGVGRTFCPNVTVKAVQAAGFASALRLLMYLRTDRSEVWVCRNGAGVLIYQGHVLSGPIDSATSDSTLLLAGRIRGLVTSVGNGYLAVNPAGTGTGSTSYFVTRTGLVVTSRPSGNASTEPAVDLYVPV